MTEHHDAVVLGGGLRGLAAGLRRQRAASAPAAPPDVLVVEAAPVPGGGVRTQRTNGFVCELGPFAFAREELAPHLALLATPPVPIAAAAAARTGHLRSLHGTHPIPVDPEPLTFRTGNEELVQAYRRELGASLRSGRPATAIDHDGAGFVVHLGGEVPLVLRTERLAIALPLAAASLLLGRFDPSLGDAAARLQSEPRAFAFFGGNAAEAGAIRGYGILPSDDLVSPLAEVIFCSEVFPGRALPGRFLIRVEVGALSSSTSDEEALALAERELRAWTGITAPFGLTKLHRFAVAVADGAAAECRARLRNLAQDVPGLVVM